MRISRARTVSTLTPRSTNCGDGTNVTRQRLGASDVGDVAVCSAAAPAGATVARDRSFPLSSSASSRPTIASIDGGGAEVRRVAITCSSSRTPSTSTSKLAPVSMRLPCRTARKQLSMWCASTSASRSSTMAEIPFSEWKLRNTSSSAADGNVEPSALSSASRLRRTATRCSSASAK